MMSNGVENLESFSSAMTYRKHLRSGHPMWWTIRSIEEDIQSMIRRYDVPRPPSLAGPAGGSPVVVRNTTLHHRADTEFKENSSIKIDK